MAMNIRQRRSLAESEMLTTLQNEINKIDPDIRIEQDTKGRQPLRKELMTLRDELKDGNRVLSKTRRVRLKCLFEEEMNEQENSMRDLGYAFIPTQP